MYPSLHAPSQHRRRLMAAGAAVLAWPALGGARQHAESGVMQWLPYDASQVMRIWIAPYIDQQDNLNWSGYVYSEVTPRRWAVGEQEVRHQGLPPQFLPR